MTIISSRSLLLLGVFSQLIVLTWGEWNSADAKTNTGEWFSSSTRSLGQPCQSLVHIRQGLFHWTLSWVTVCAEEELFWPVVLQFSVHLRRTAIDWPVAVHCWCCSAVSLNLLLWQQGQRSQTETRTQGKRQGFRQDQPSILWHNLFWLFCFFLNPAYY